jgi:hypothetical protein
MLDNVLTRPKQWHFDSLTSPPHLLKSRSGHQAPPHLIRFYGEDGKQLLTASRDRSLRCTSVVRDSRSFELSQGLSVSLVETPLGDPHFPRLSYKESDYIICTPHFPQALLHHSIVILNDEIQRLG